MHEISRSTLNISQLKRKPVHQVSNCHCRNVNSSVLRHYVHTKSHPVIVLLVYINCESNQLSPIGGIYWEDLSSYCSINCDNMSLCVTMLIDFHIG